MKYNIFSQMVHVLRYVPVPVLEQSSTVATADIGHWHNIAGLTGVLGVFERRRRPMRWVTSDCHIGRRKNVIGQTLLRYFLSIDPCRRASFSRRHLSPGSLPGCRKSPHRFYVIDINPPCHANASTVFFYVHVGLGFERLGS